MVGGGGIRRRGVGGMGEGLGVGFFDEGFVENERGVVEGAVVVVVVSGGGSNGVWFGGG